ncbi:MAG: hypothetical protein HY951_19305 [Bacteroidia bacterium]|nr:hypothetical protein [Bacteroidia bacterium]
MRLNKKNILNSSLKVIVQKEIIVASRVMIQVFLFVIFIVVNGNSYAQISVDSHNEAIELINLSNIEIKQESYTNAITKLEKAIKLDSSIREAYTLINHALFQTGNIKTQKKYLNKAKLFFYEDDEFCYHSGKLYLKEDKIDSAIFEFNKAIKFSKTNGEDYPIVFDYYSSRGICYLKKNMYSEALEDFNYAVKLNNSKAGIYANKGIVLFKLKRMDEACISWKKAQELGEKSVKTYIDKYCK